MLFAALLAHRARKDKLVILRNARTTNRDVAFDTSAFVDNCLMHQGTDLAAMLTWAERACVQRRTEQSCKIPSGMYCTLHCTTSSKQRCFEQARNVDFRGDLPSPSQTACARRKPVRD